MPDKDQTQTVDLIHQLMSNINQAWIKGRPQELKVYFHPDIQFVGPNLEILGSGREACIKSYQDFTNQALIQKFSERDHDVNIWGNSAIISYMFNIEYEMNAKLHADTGRDLFVFTLEGSRWLAVWRLLLSE